MRVAILPAGGQGVRMRQFHPTPKQLLSLKNGLVMDYALKAAKMSGAHLHVIVPPEDERIARYVHSKEGFVTFSYALPNLLASIYALRPIYGKAQILYMMPDTVFKPLSAFNDMFLKLDFPVVIGIFRTTTPQKLGMCRLDRPSSGYGWVDNEDNRIIGVEDKPSSWQGPPIAWGLLAWRDHFWDCLAQVKADNMTEVIGKAIDMFGPLPTAWLEDYVDVGSPEDYERVLIEGW